MTAKDYKVTFPYMATTAPYSPTRPHLGEDRKMPLGTPIEVNGVLVGYAGTTGKSTGVHTHTQRVYGGAVIHPQGGGFDVPQPAVVTETGYKKDTIGYYVRYKDGQGFEWSIFHMDKPASVRVGQQLIKGDTMQLTKDHLDVMRIIVSEMDLFPPADVHAGKYDQLLLDTFTGQNLDRVIRDRYPSKVRLALEAASQPYKEVGIIDGQKVYRKG